MGWVYVYINMNHWINIYGDEEKINKNIRGDNWGEPEYKGDDGPIVIKNQANKMEIYIVRATFTGTFRIELTDKDDNLKGGESYRISQEGFDNILEWLKHYTKHN